MLRRESWYIPANMLVCNLFFQTMPPRINSDATVAVTRELMQKAKMMARNPENQLPMLDCANECTELTTPLRVRNVPRIESMKVIKISQTFHIFIMPRFSCIMTE